MIKETFMLGLFCKRKIWKLNLFCYPWYTRKFPYTCPLSSLILIICSIVNAVWWLRIFYNACCYSIMNDKFKLI